MAQQAQFLIGCDENSMQTELSQCCDDPPCYRVRAARESFIENDSAKQRSTASVRTQGVTKRRGQHIRRDDFLFSTATALRACSGFNNAPGLTINDRYSKFQAEPWVQKRFGTQVSTVITCVLEKQDKRFEGFVMAFALVFMVRSPKRGVS